MNELSSIQHEIERGLTAMRRDLGIDEQIRTAPVPCKMMTMLAFALVMGVVLGFLQ